MVRMNKMAHLFNYLDLDNLNLVKTDLKMEIVDATEDESVDEGDLDEVFSLIYVENILEDDTNDIVDNQFKQEKDREVNEVRIPSLISEKRKDAILDKTEDTQYMNEREISFVKRDNSNYIVTFIKMAIPYFLITWIMYRYGFWASLLNSILIIALLFSATNLIIFLNKDLLEEELTDIVADFFSDRQLFVNAILISFLVSSFYNITAILVVFAIFSIGLITFKVVTSIRYKIYLKVYSKVLEFVKENLSKDLK